MRCCVDVVVSTEPFLLGAGAMSTGGELAAEPFCVDILASRQSGRSVRLESRTGCKLSIMYRAVVGSVYTKLRSGRQA